LQTKKYEVSFKPVARKRLANLESSLRLRILEAVFKLAVNPFPPGAKQLVGKNGLRIRVGDYRVVYEANGAQLLVLVVQVGHRREIYR
jgi:mRNA interferase RelE/StbE